MKAAGSLAAFDIPAGMTAYSLAVSPETAVAYAPQQGDHVMVVGCMLLTDVDSSFQTRLPNDTVITFGAQSTAAEPSGAISLGVQAGAPFIDGDAISRGRFELESTVNQPIYVLPSEVQRPRLVCQSVIQDAMVLNVGMFALEAEKAGSAVAEPTQVVIDEESPAPAGPAYPGSITIIVSPQDTLILNYLSLAGAKLSLALKSAGDTAPYTTDPVTLQYIMDQKNIPAPVKLPFGVEPRVDTLVFPTFEPYILDQP